MVPPRLTPQLTPQPQRLPVQPRQRVASPSQQMYQQQPQYQQPIQPQYQHSESIINQSSLSTPRLDQRAELQSMHSYQSERVDPAVQLERQLRDIFNSVDRDLNGSLTEGELRKALLNQDGTQFQASTVRLMIRLFDNDGTSTIEFQEFCHLWNYVSHWRKTFQKYDTDQNSKITFAEYQEALSSFGYRLPTDIVLFVFTKFGEFNQNKPLYLNFDGFVESLIWLLRCTNIFKKFDLKGNGVATISFQDFVHEIIAFI